MITSYELRWDLTPLDARVTDRCIEDVELVVTGTEDSNSSRKLAERAKKRGYAINS